MTCSRPFVSGAHAFPCGQCMSCRRKHRRLWTSRLLLEQLCHASSCFITLTYAEDRCPDELRPDHLRDFLKRLRRRVHPARLRFYGVGEYGSRTERPHYHLALYGYPHCTGASARSPRFIIGECPCSPCSVVREAWGFGHVLVGTLEGKSAAYISRYVLKKMTRRDDLRLRGRHPEFVRMSLRPGLGALVVPAVFQTLQSVSLHKKLLDVPLTIRVGPRKHPLGRYLRTMLRKQLFGNGAQATLPQNEALSVLRTYAWQSGKSVSSVFSELFGVQDQPLDDRGSL